MSDQPFDDLVKRLATTPRRHALRLLGGVLLGGLPPRLTAEDAAACVRLGKACGKGDRCCTGGCKRGTCRCPDGRRPCRNACIPDGRCCDDADCGGNACRDGLCGPCPRRQKFCNGACIPNGDCCTGDECAPGQACVAGSCQATPEGTCAPGDDSCVNPSIGCNDNPDCACSTTSEGETRCSWSLTPGRACGQCTSSAECASFGPGAFCVKTAGTNCCGPHAENVCRLPCPA